jgi:hypothetical protein
MSGSFYGFKNYETWTTSQHILEDWRLHEAWHRKAMKIKAQNRPERIFTREEVAVRELAFRLQHTFEGQVPVTGGLFGDLLTAVLSEIAWHEIARILLEEQYEQAAQS